MVITGCKVRPHMTKQRNTVGFSVDLHTLYIYSVATLLGTLNFNDCRLIKPSCIDRSFRKVRMFGCVATVQGRFRMVVAFILSTPFTL